MATYDPTNWKTGDVITATKLNNMETGIVGALQTSGGTMTGNITMSGDAQLIGNASTSNYNKINNLSNDASTDLNNIIEYGYYATVIGSATKITNKPQTSYDYSIGVLVMPWARGVNIFQMAFCIRGNLNFDIFVRNSNGNLPDLKWSEWKRINLS